MCAYEEKVSPQRIRRPQRGILELQIHTDESPVNKVAILLRKMKAERAKDVESISRLLVRMASLDVRLILLRSFL